MFLSIGYGIVLVLLESGGKNHKEDESFRKSKLCVKAKTIWMTFSPKVERYIQIPPPEWVVSADPY